MFKLFHTFSNSRRKSLFATALACCVATVSTAAGAVTFGFGNIPSDNTSGDSLAQYLSVDITDYSGLDPVCAGCALFRFSYGANASTGFVTTIYFDDSANPNVIKGASSSDVLFVADQSSTGVAFTYANSGPTNLPQGNKLTPKFSTDFIENSNNGDGNLKAIHPGETLALAIAYNKPLSNGFQDVIDAIYAGSLRIGLHVQGIGEKSDSYINLNTVSNTMNVPLPGGLLLLGSGLGTLFVASRRRRFATA